MRGRTLGVLTGALLLAGCGGNSDGARDATSDPTPRTQAGAEDARFPNVRAASLTVSGAGLYTLSATVSSPYDTPERYADGWRVLEAGSSRVLGEHELTHDHASEQPFTREQTGLRIPASVNRVTIEGRDKKNGYGGGTVTIDVPR